MKSKTSILKEVLLTGVLAFLLFGPITGALLTGFNIEIKFLRPLVLTGIVMFGRFLFLICPRPHFKTDNAHTLVRSKPKPRIIINTALIILGLIAAFFMGKYWLTVAILTLIYILLGLGLNIVVGLAGLLDLGFVAFYAVGAYSYALGAEYLHLNFWMALPFAMLLAATFGAVLGFPVLRMHGDYLAIVTLGFGEIINRILTNWGNFTGGPSGVNVPFPTLFGLEFTRKATQGGTPFHEAFYLPYSTEYRYIFTYCVLFFIVCLMLKFVSRLKLLPLGRTWEALREDEIACRSLGINHVTTKLTAFSMGAMIGGLGGVFFAAYQGFVNPVSFTFIESAMILAIVVLGGMGSTLGVVLAACALTLLPEVLREFAEYRMLVFGGLMLLMMIWRPRGLVRSVRYTLERPKDMHG